MCRKKERTKERKKERKLKKGRKNMESRNPADWDQLTWQSAVTAVHWHTVGWKRETTLELIFKTNKPSYSTDGVCAHVCTRVSLVHLESGSWSGAAPRDRWDGGRTWLCCRGSWPSRPRPRPSSCKSHIRMHQFLNCVYKNDGTVKKCRSFPIYS